VTRPRELVQATSDKVLRYRIEVMALAADDVVANLGGCCSTAVALAGTPW
jgi:hypothetical protein